VRQTNGPSRSSEHLEDYVEETKALGIIMPGSLSSGVFSSAMTRGVLSISRTLFG
jgi:hypothetical protein